MIIDRAHCLDGGQRLPGIFELAPVRHTRCAIEQNAHQSAACIKANLMVPLVRAVRGFVFDVTTRTLNQVT